MDFSLYHSTGSISRATSTVSTKFSAKPKTSTPVPYLELLGCEIQEARGMINKSGINNYSYSVYFPMDDEDGLGLVQFVGVAEGETVPEAMTMKQYLSREDCILIKEGDYFEGVVDGKTVNGKIVFYLANQLGCKLGIEDIGV